jgi:hypothetical protein
MPDFLRPYIMFSVVLTMVLIGISLFIPPSFRTPALPYLIMFFFLVGVGVKLYLRKMKAKRFAAFVNAFLVTSFLKLFLYLIVMVIYISLNRKDAIPFAVTFFLLYLSYSVYDLLGFLKDKGSN